VSSNVSEAQAVMRERSIGLVFCESDLPEGGFRPVLHTLKLAGSRAPLVVCSLLGELEEYLEAMQLGAFDFIRPPYRHAEVEVIVKSALCEHMSTADHPELQCSRDRARGETRQP
jgi:DNA-binding NtrC family response regulator